MRKVILVAAILVAVLFLESPWDVLLVAGAVIVEVAEALFWLRLSRRRPAVTGREALLGENARVVSRCAPDGRVRLHGELWNARCDSVVEAGETVRVRSVDGLTLVVEPDRAS